jgi:hypothetical protein
MLRTYLCHIRFRSEIFANVLAVRSLEVKVILRPTVSRPVCLGVKHPSGDQDQIFITVKTVAGLLMWGTHSNKKTGLSFTIVAGPRQRSHSRGIRVPRDS